MKRLNIEPTDKNLAEQFYRDSIERNADILQFVSLLNSIDENCSISVDALWGAGKTFFVKQVKMVLNVFNEFTVPLPQDIKKQITQAWNQISAQEKLELQPQVCVYYDAWANDNDADPILSLVHSILLETKADFPFKKDARLADIVASLAETISGRQVKQLIDTMRKDDYLDSIKNNKDIYQLVTDFLDSLLLEKGNRLVVIVDELDRCKPDYAVRLLERVKHYFSNDRITFVFSINSHQLQHTIRQHYGVGFDASRYLDRFFDLSIELPPANMKRFYKSVGLENGSWVYETVCSEIAESFNMQMREITRFYNMAKIAAYRPTHDQKEQGWFQEAPADSFCNMLLVPFLIALKMTDRSAFVGFVTGKDGNAIHKAIKMTDVASYYKHMMLTQDETFEKINSADNRKLVRFEDKVDEVYYALFKHDYVSAYHYDIGAMSFTKETRNKLLRTASALSGHADYSL